MESKIERVARAILSALESSSDGNPYIEPYQPVTIVDGDRYGGTTIDGRGFDLEAAARAAVRELFALAIDAPGSASTREWLQSVLDEPTPAKDEPRG